ncbi:MAG TPA: GMC family oxidoreductase [Saprospiraceae bacterium]|nr:GMC family oxidoreductase [Saprospiraceae bacterium]
MKMYDAIVIGTGITGGWAAKELCEKGLHTLVLDRGRNIQHGEYPTANMDSWDLPNNGKLSREELLEYPVQRRAGYIDHATQHLWVRDKEHPYHEDHPFDWIRGNHVGGRSLMWGRQVYRWSDLDFEANAKEGVGVDWPIRYNEIAPWYDYVEKYIGVSGKAEGIPHLPDGQFLPPMDYFCIEEHFVDRIRDKYNDRIVTMGRVANLTRDLPGRTRCQFRNRCIRGCPYGAYFSSQSSTLPAAMATGKMELRPLSIVKRILFNQLTQKATGVEVIDSETHEVTEYGARIIFLCASTLGSTQILLQSSSERFPNGMGNDSGELGCNLMDHHCYAGASGSSDLFLDLYYKGRRPNGIYIPRYQNINEKTRRSHYIRGFAYQGSCGRESWWRGIREAEFGAVFKEASFRPGLWKLGLISFGECLPYHDNKTYLHPSKKDMWGLPQLALKAEWKKNELAMRKDMQNDAAEMLENAGFKNIVPFDHVNNPGGGIHEMGTARMGYDPKDSVLNRWNQIHAVKNVFVTDGACMTSSACQNPSLTYMALTARAVGYAFEQLKKNEL